MRKVRKIINAEAKRETGKAKNARVSSTDDRFKKYHAMKKSHYQLVGVNNSI